MTPNRPRGRQKNVTGTGKPIKRRGSGLGTGPVGGAGRGQGIGGFNPTPRPQRSYGSGGGGFGKLIILVLLLLFGGGGGLTAMLGGGSDVPEYNDYPSYSDQGSNTQTPTIDLEALLGGLNTGSVSSGWESESGNGALDTTVVSGAREKYTRIQGSGKDEMTILVYLCGTDLESRSRMATSDLQEMLDATVSEKVNLIVYTGGCKHWQNNVISSRNNQIWQVKDEGLVCLDDDAGSEAMVRPETLSDFIRYGAKKFPESGWTGHSACGFRPACP